MKIKINNELYVVNKKLYKKGIKEVKLFENATDLVLWRLEPNSVTPTVIFLYRDKHGFLSKLIHNIWGDKANWTSYKWCSEQEGLEILKQYLEAAYE